MSNQSPVCSTPCTHSPVPLSLQTYPALHCFHLHAVPIVRKIGFEGVINTIETDNHDTDYKIVDGYIVDNTGYAHNIFINNFDKGIVEYDNPNIYIINNKITNFNSLIPILNETIDPLKDDFKPTVIICHDIDEAPL